MGDGRSPISSDQPPDGQIGMMQNFQGQGIVWIIEIAPYNGKLMVSEPAMA
jgi:hypothetical protein